MANALLKLNTGAQIPVLGFGTWQSPDRPVRAAVAHAIQVSNRHIDCAYVYGNEEEVGEGIAQDLAATGLSRKDLFITTKLWCTYHTRVEQALNTSLKLLGLDYVDVYLMHWPIAMNPNGHHEKFPKLPDGSRDLVREHSHVKTYKDMEKLLKTGKVRAIGVCNYSRKFLEELLAGIDVIPAVNQIENDPLLPQQEILDLCRENGILVTAYSPLGSTGSPMMKNPHVVKLAKEKNVSEGATLLNYHIAQGRAVLAKSVTPSRVEANRSITSLSPADLDSLAQIFKSGVTRFVYPEFGVDFGFPDKS